MKRLILLFLHFPVIICAQISFDFESGSLETWVQSRDSSWIATETGVLSGTFSLRHNLDDSISGEDRISFAYDSLVLDASKTTWQFMLKHSYLPSSSNKWALFLISDQDQEQMRPGGLANAVILGVNFKGSDDFLQLWRMSKGITEVLALTSLNWQDEIGTDAATIKVERSDAGDWNIFIAGINNQTWQLIGQGRETQLSYPGYFGVYYRFSSKQDRKLWIDDISVQGSFVTDNVPPGIVELKILDENMLRLIFSEPLDPETALISEKYSLLASGMNPDSVFFHSQNSLDLVFGEAFESGMANKLRIEKIADQKGNVSDILEKEFTWFKATQGDIIFSEILFDPAPVIGLPENEFLEVHNRSGFPLDIGGWRITTGTKSITIPEYNLASGAYLLLCYKDSENKYPGTDNILDALTSRTMFSNEGAAIFLYDRDSLLIDWMKYSAGMHENEYYATGGWSLEKIDISRDCFGEDNWTSSRDKNGGTPGKENSVTRLNPDLESPEILSVYVNDPYNLVVEFSETMSIQSLCSKESGLPDTGESHSIWGEFYSFSGGEVWRIEPGPGSPDSIIVNYPFINEVRLVYGERFDPGKDYYLEPDPGIVDCSGNSIADGTRYRFAIPIQPGRSEILLSEILFNPMPFCPDFVEFYNPGTATFDIADLLVGNRDTETDEISSVIRIMTAHRLFFPEDYLVLTEDAEALCGCYTVYSRDAIIEVGDLPTLGDDNGSVLLLDKYLEVIDEFCYDKHMHHPGLSSGEGVSLERISYLSPAENRANWHSASSNEGFGTPGRQNSQYGEINISEEGFELDPEIFTPDLDGVNDKLFIKYRFNSPGLTARILIFDPRGRLIKDIAGTQLLGTQGFFTWDGTNRNGEMARAGIYLVYAEVYGTASGNQKFRKTCVLSRRL